MQRFPARSAQPNEACNLRQSSTDWGILCACQCLLAWIRTAATRANTDGAQVTER